MFDNKTLIFSSILITSPILYYYYISLIDKKVQNLETKINLLNIKYADLYENYANIIDIFNQTQLKIELDKKNEEIEKTLLF